MGTHRRPPSAARLRRLADELEETGYVWNGDEPRQQLLLTEIDHALRPALHEGRAPSTRALDGPDEWCVFDRPSGSERDLVVLSAVMEASVVQRHPTGAVRVADPQGVLRWNGTEWRHEPPLGAWLSSVTATPEHGDPAVLTVLLEFAVHDLGSRGIGAILVYRPDGGDPPSVEARLPTPPPLQITRATVLAPLRHALAQVDGAAMFGASGILEQLGVRLVPSRDAEQSVAGFAGMRHTSARRYSFDDPMATVVVVSEDGPVTVLRAGELVGTSPTVAEIEA